MAIGSVKKYNGLTKKLMSDANRQWDDATAGSCMFILADNSYTFDATDITAADLAGVITVGDGAPINITTPTLNDTTTAGSTFIDSDDADWGTPVTITAKWIICVQPVTAGTYASTAKLLFAFDLDNSSGSAEITITANEFKYLAPTNGWIKFT